MEKESAKERMENILHDSAAKNGVRKEKHFSTLPEARNWLADQQYNDRHDLVVANPNMTVDVWFEFWLNHLICDLAPNTRRNYQERYTHNIQPVLGNMLIADVKPMHCKAVLNRMDTEYAGSTIRQTYIAMGTMFRSAIMNDIIAKHPMDGVRYTKPVRAVDDIHFLTREEQAIFWKLQNAHITTDNMFCYSKPVCGHLS